ncbi:tail fiber protein [Acinetobacter johnsonii]|uniref:tail fiber protein n=1 Tax=Acinetobacter johnsonii TaxID=40214 RepID=UPI001D184890
MVDEIEANFIRKNQIVDNLTTNDATKPVSAKQAKKLQDTKLEASDLKDASTTTKGIVQLNNTLTSTSATQALTAAQGKLLNDNAFGVGQTSSEKTIISGTTYTNTGTKAKMYTFSITGSSGNRASLGINGFEIFGTNTSNVFVGSFVVSVGEYFSITGNSIKCMEFA